MKNKILDLFQSQEMKKHIVLINKIDLENKLDKSNYLDVSQIDITVITKSDLKNGKSYCYKRRY